jgi:hypothetical protein
VIDFGTSQSIWDSGTESGDYVKFRLHRQQATSHAFDFNNISNIRIYGGDYSTGANGGIGGGIIGNTPTTAHFWDMYVNDLRNGTVFRSFSKDSSNCVNATIRFEVNRFAMNPYGWDTHADKGTGMHGCILHGNSGGIHDSRFVIYAHDPLRPGETSAGKTYPEGAGGSVIEQGNDTAANYDNVTLYALGVNCLMVPNGTNPGSAAKQTGGNVVNLWGHIKLNGNVIGWAEGRNCTGSIIHSDNGSWFPGSPPLSVTHGRHTHTNQSTVGGNIATPYPTTTPLGATLGIVYNDCT